MFHGHSHKIGVIGSFVGELYSFVYDLILSKIFIINFENFEHRSMIKVLIKNDIESKNFNGCFVTC